MYLCITKIEPHKSCWFPDLWRRQPELPASFYLDDISYEDWSASAQLAFLNAVKIFPMNTYCKRLFSRDHGPHEEWFFFHQFFTYLLKFVGNIFCGMVL